MCLTNLTETNKTIIRGYKVFIKNIETGELLQPIFHIRNDKRDPDTGAITLLRTYRKIVPQNIWLKAARKKIYFYTKIDPSYYWSGFHFFEEKKYAQLYMADNRDWILINFKENFELVVKNIEVQQVTASGFQDSYPCHVARYMKIINGDTYVPIKTD